MHYIIQKVKLFPKKITDSIFIKTLVNWSKRTAAPGCQGVSVFHISRFLWYEVTSSSLPFRANSIAFSQFLSLFPLLMVIFGLLPYLPIKKSLVLLELKHELDVIMPNKTGAWLYETIEFFLERKRSDVLSIGTLLALYFSSNGMMSLMESFEKSHPVFRKRNGFEKRIRAIGITIMLGFLMFASMALAIWGNQILAWASDFFNLKKSVKILIQIFRWFIVLFLTYLGTAFIYRFGVAMRRKIHLFSPGALVAMFLSVVSSWGFSFFVDNFGRYDKLYGAISSVIVLMLWIQTNAIILIFGFELNAAIAVHRATIEEDEAKEALPDIVPTTPQ